MANWSGCWPGSVKAEWVPSGETAWRPTGSHREKARSKETPPFPVGSMVTDVEENAMKAFLVVVVPTGMEIGSRQENESRLRGRSPGMGLGEATATGLAELFAAAGCPVCPPARVTRISTAGQPRIVSFKRGPSGSVSHDPAAVAARRGRSHFERSRHARLHLRRLQRLPAPRRPGGGGGGRGGGR